MRAAHRVAETVLTPADRLRRWALVRLTPFIRPWLRSRERRVVVMALVGLAFSAVMTASWPLVLLMWGPVLLGLPHLAADFRYLALRPGGLGEGTQRWAMGLALLAMWWFKTPAVGFLAAFAAVAFAGRDARRVWMMLFVSAIIAVSWMHPRPVKLVVAHGHNLVAVWLWWLWRPPTMHRAKPIVVFCAIFVAILVGAFDVLLPAHEGLWRGFCRALAPGLEPVLAGRVVLSFAFAQSVHYGIWLRWIPEDDRHQRTPRPFFASWRAACHELGGGLVLATLVGVVGLLLWALVDLEHAHRGYLRFVSFHGYLELAVIFAWLAGAPAPWDEASRPGPTPSMKTLLH